MHFRKEEQFNASFSSKLSAQDIICKVISIHKRKSAILSLHHATMEESFDLDDKFCDADDLQSFMKHLRQTYEITQCGKSSISMFEHSGRTTKHEAIILWIFEFFLIFPNFLTS